MSSAQATDPRPGMDLGEEGSPLPVFSRQATGLVREVSVLQMVAYNATATNPLGLGLVIFAFALVVFPRANPYLAIGIAGLLCVSVWVAYALMTAAIPRVGGDYTINTRVLPPWLALGGNIGAFLNGIIAAPLFAYLFAVGALSPALTVIGSVTHSSTLIRWGTYFSTSHRGVVLAVALLSLLAISVLSALGTRVVMRVLTVLVVIAAVGILVDLLIVLFTSHASFVNTLDAASGRGAYAKTVALGAKQGLSPSNGGYSASATLGAIYLATGVTIWTFWGTYMASEFRGGGQRRRQLWTMAGTGVFNTLALLALIYLFTRTVGYDFFVSSLNGNFSGVGNGAINTAGYVYFGALVASNKVVVTLLALAFLGWFLPAVYINISMPQRAFLTWSFDGLLPRWLSSVNERTHTPIRSIALCFVLCVPITVWLSLSSNALGVITTSALFGYVTITLVGVSAAIAKWRRPDIYRGSPAEWRVLGIEVLPLAGVGCALMGVFLIVLAMHFHVALGLTYYDATIACAIGLFVVSGVWWLVAKAVRRNQGLDLSMSYRAIPPD